MEKTDRQELRLENISKSEKLKIAQALRTLFNQKEWTESVAELEEIVISDIRKELVKMPDLPPIDFKTHYRYLEGQIAGIIRVFRRRSELLKLGDEEEAEEARNKEKK